MKKIFNYENIWTRNIFVFIQLFALIFLQENFVSKPKDAVIMPFWQLLLMVFILYLLVLFNNLVLVKQFLFKKLYFKYLCSTIIFVLSVSFLYLNLCDESEQNGNYIEQLIGSFFTVLLGTSIYFIHNWILDNITSSKKELINKEAELAFLKHQISPHFLFNSLNNLYGISLAAPEMISEKILELSVLLRYQIESTKIDLVPIDSEISFIENYLKYIRFKSNNLITTNQIEGKTINLQMPPLLVLPLIENAVKYSSESDNPTINISWHLMPNYIKFEIKNTYKTSESRIIGTKTGLDNLRKRLDLLQIKYELYSKPQLLDINDGMYHITLELWK